MIVSWWLATGRWFSPGTPVSSINKTDRHDITEILLSEWLWFNANSAISWREQVNFQWDDDEVRFVLDQHAELDFYSAISLKQQSAGKHVAPLRHIILIQSQPVFALSP
jgi:hypothetical protein